MIPILPDNPNTISHVQRFVPRAKPGYGPEVRTLRRELRVEVLVNDQWVIADVAAGFKHQERTESNARIVELQSAISKLTTHPIGKTMKPEQRQAIQDDLVQLRRFDTYEGKTCSQREELKAFLNDLLENTK